LALIFSEDRVQWHRAWAEMTRWLEEFKLKHVEMRQCIAYFYHMHTVWSSLASKSTNLGYQGFAGQQAEIYLGLHDNAELLFLKNGEPRLIAISETNLVKTVQDFRDQELAWLKQLACGGKSV
jgi:hypothetical protein